MSPSARPIFEMEEALSSTSHGADSGGRNQHEHRHQHRSSRHHEQEGLEENDRHRHKRARHLREEDESEGHRARRRHHHGHHRQSQDTAREKSLERTISKDGLAQDSPDIKPREGHSSLKRDTWMESPSALDIDYTQKGLKKAAASKILTSTIAEPGLKVHKKKINLLQQGPSNDHASKNPESDQNGRHVIDYSFGDSGSSWRMTQLKAVYRIAEETGRDRDDVAEERYGNLEAFDNAREERNELDRREMYGRGYVGKEKPSGELFTERKSNINESSKPNRDESPPDAELYTTSSISTAPRLSQTELNRLKAQLMKATLKNSTNVAQLEKEYNAAAKNFQVNGEPDVVVLDTMANRMLVGGRQGEVKSIDSKRGRERGLVEENEDMSIEDMVREERRTRGQAGGEGQRFAERIAKDVKFDVSRPIILVDQVLMSLE
jgi:hypothetical protein